MLSAKVEATKLGVGECLDGLRDDDVALHRTFRCRIRLPAHKGGKFCEEGAHRTLRLHASDTGDKLV